MKVTEIIQDIQNGTQENGIRIRVDAIELHKLGWCLGDDGSTDEAEWLEDKGVTAYIDIEPGQTFFHLDWMQDGSRLYTDREPCGDDSQTIKDVITLYNAGIISNNNAEWL